MPKPSIKGALDASLNAETAAFQQRLARADAHAQGAASPALDEATEGAAPVARVVREAFTLPENERAQIETIRAAQLSRAVAVSKSEVLRAGLLLLAEAEPHVQQQIFERIERIKTGRPKTT